MSEEVVFSVDWVSITIHHGEGVDVWTVFRDLGISWLDLLIDSGHGGQGYDSLYWLDLGHVKPISLYFGSHLPYSTLVCSGQGVDWLGGGSAVFALIRGIVYSGYEVKFTRLDVAFDTLAFSPSDFWVACGSGGLVSRVERRNIEQRHSFDAGAGHTVYVGSPKSESRLRVYTKLDALNHPLGDVFTRVELQLRSARADALGSDLLDDMDNWFSLSFSTLKGFVDFTAWDVWQSFSGAYPRHWHKLGAPAQSIARSVVWLFDQVSATLAVLKQVMGRDAYHDFIDDLDNHGRVKMSSRHRTLVRAYEGVDVKNVLELVKKRV